MDEDHEHTFGLVVAFPDPSESFTLGFEAGRMDQRMSDGATPIEECVHTKNEEIYRRLANYQGYAMEWRASEVEGWSYIELRKVRPSGQSHNPHGLRVVPSPGDEKP